MQTEDFEIEISEVDRQTAERFCSIWHCIIATACLNRGLNVITAGPNYVRIDNPENVFYCQNPWWFGNDSTTKPFYKPEIVGQILKFSKTETSYEDLLLPNLCPQEQKLTTSTKS